MNVQEKHTVMSLPPVKTRVDRTPARATRNTLETVLNAITTQVTVRATKIDATMMPLMFSYAYKYLVLEL